MYAYKPVWPVIRGRVKNAVDLENDGPSRRAGKCIQYMMQMIWLFILQLSDLARHFPSPAFSSPEIWFVILWFSGPAHFHPCPVLYSAQLIALPWPLMISWKGGYQLFDVFGDFFSALLPRLVSPAGQFFCARALWCEVVVLVCDQSSEYNTLNTIQWCF